MIKPFGKRLSYVLVQVQLSDFRLPQGGMDGMDTRSRFASAVRLNSRLLEDDA